jgi:hypothetical protein
LHPIEKYSAIHGATKSQLDWRTGKYIEYIGMTMDEFKSLSEKIKVVLIRNGLSTNEIRKETGNSKNTSHIVNLLCDEGILVRGKIKGSWKSNNHIYYRFEDFFNGFTYNDYPEEKTIEDLVLNYVRSYGPVTEPDIIWWSGLKKTAVRNVIEKNRGKIEKVYLSDLSDEYFMSRDKYEEIQELELTDNNIINYLPALDPYVMGYKNRDRYIDMYYYNYVFDRFGNASPTIILNGKIIGIWDINPDKKIVKYFLFESFDDEIYQKIVTGALQTGLFYRDKETDLVEIRSTIPVKGLTVGSFMSPLKNA